MTDQLQIRLKEIARECGGNRALCDRSGVSERTFANWLAGSSEPKIIGISAIARAAGVTVDWLVNGTKPKYRLGAYSLGDNQSLQIPVIEKVLSEEGRSLDQRLSVCDHMPFTQGFFKQRLAHQNFDALCILKVSGDSMEPTMGDADLALVDRSQTVLEDGIYAFVFKNQIHIKRLANRLNGIDVISDNHSLYPAHNIPASELGHMDIIGRVVWVGKMLV